MLLGIGMGGEWASGAALVSETWPAEHRGKALGFMQSAWAIGYAAAVLVSGYVQPHWGWRAVFFVGILPAFFTLWVRRSVEEPAMWRAARARPAATRARFADIFGREMIGLTLAVTLMNTCTLFAWWGFNLWLPSYLSLPAASGGIGLSTATMSLFVIAMQVGMWFGYVTFGFISDAIGRKRTYVTYLLTAAVLIACYVSIRSPLGLLVLGPFVAFFATGYFSGFGAVTAEIYPTDIRATAQGFTYNIGRIASAAAPFAVGSLAQTRGFDFALLLTSVAFLLAAITWIWIPETRGLWIPPGGAGPLTPPVVWGRRGRGGPGSGPAGVGGGGGQPFLFFFAGKLPSHGPPLLFFHPLALPRPFLFLGNSAGTPEGPGGGSAPGRLAGGPRREVGEEGPP